MPIVIPLGVVLTVLALSACTTTRQTGAAKVASTPAGQLFCQVNGTDGATVVGIINAAASAAMPAASPVAILATGLAKVQVDAICAQAAANVGAAAGVPVSPPGSAVGNVAVVVPKSA